MRGAGVTSPTSQQDSPRRAKPSRTAGALSGGTAKSRPPEVSDSKSSPTSGAGSERADRELTARPERTLEMAAIALHRRRSSAHPRRARERPASSGRSFIRSVMPAPEASTISAA